MTCVASLIIQEEPGAPASILPKRWWSLNLVVAGVFHQIGQAVAHTEQEAAQIFARELSRPSTD